jgi:hypothetical protein
MADAPVCLRPTAIRWHPRLFDVRKEAEIWRLPDAEQVAALVAKFGSIPK